MVSGRPRVVAAAGGRPGDAPAGAVDRGAGFAQHAGDAAARPAGGAGDDGDPSRLRRGGIVHLTPAGRAVY